jgi:hypothetical protein
MPAFYKIDKEHGLVMSTASGVFDLAAALGHQDKLLADPEFDPRFSQLWDLSQVTRVELSPQDVRRLAERRVFWSCAPRAILVNSDLEFGFARMFEMLRENAGDTGIRVFRDLHEALEWVLPAAETGS